MSIAHSQSARVSERDQERRRQRRPPSPATAVAISVIDGLLVINAIDLIETFMKGTEWGFRTSYVTLWTALTTAAVIGLITTRRSVHTAFGLVILLWNNGLRFYENRILGDW